MQISARSYLTAGISLTAASAIALTPLAIPANERAVTIPNVTVSDIQLTVTPQEIQAFFTNLQGELEEFNAGVAELVGLPGQTLADALGSAITLNENFYDTLRGLTTNTTLLNLLDALELSSTYGLESLQIAIQGIDEEDLVVYGFNENLVLTTEQLSNLLAGSITGSLSNVLSSFVAVLNNPLDVSAYAGLLSTGLVDTVGDLASNGLSAVSVIGNSGFDFASTGLWLLQDQIDNAIATVVDLSNVAAGATGSALIAAVTQAVQSLTLAPAQAISDVAFGITNDVLGAFQGGFNEILGGLNGYFVEDGENETFVPGIVQIVSGSLQFAINTIGANPLNPENYLVATGGLLAGGFDTFNTGVRTVGNVAQIPGNLGINVTNGITGVITDLNLTFATALSSVLTAVGLPEDIADLPVTLATQFNAVIEAGADAIVSGFEIVNGVIETGTDFVIDVSNDIENAIIGVLPAPEADAAVNTLAAESEAPAQKAAAEPDPSGDVVAVVNDTEEEEAVAEETPAAEEAAPAAEAPADDEAPAADDEAPADDDAASDDDADDKGSYSSKREDRKAARDAKKAEREAAKADSDDSSSASDSDDSSDSDSDAAA
jgi:hypothetical protein